MLDTKELLSKVRRIEIKTRKIVDELTGGAYHSVFKGRGIEFSEVRPYTEGDDVRDIDWNVTARTGSAYIKKYVEERELTVMLAVDVSASLDFGTSADLKREKAAEIAALLAFSAIRNNDKVGLLLFSDRTELYLPPRSGRLHVLRLIRELLNEQPRHPGTDVGYALENLSRILKRKAVVFLISDLADDRNFEKPLKLLARKHDVSVIRISDDFEQKIEKTAGLELEDSESGRRFEFDGNSRNDLIRYEAVQNAFSLQMRERCIHAKTDLIELSCAGDPVKSLMSFFHGRSKH